MPAARRSRTAGAASPTSPRADLSGLAPLPPGGVTVLSDVTNPLLGRRVRPRCSGRRRAPIPTGRRARRGARAARALLDVDPATPGAGAAGGTGFGLLAWGATLVPGSAAVAELIGLRAAVAAASVVVTGEGSFDGQSAAGKVPAHVAALAAEAGTPVALVAGRIAADADVSAFAGTVSLTDLAGSPRGGDGRPGALADRGRGRARPLARLTGV